MTERKAIDIRLTIFEDELTAKGIDLDAEPWRGMTRANFVRQLLGLPALERGGVRAGGMEPGNTLSRRRGSAWIEPQRAKAEGKILSAMATASRDFPEGMLTNDIVRAVKGEGRQWARCAEHLARMEQKRLVRVTEGAQGRRLYWLTRRGKEQAAREAGK